MARLEWDSAAAKPRARKAGAGQAPAMRKEAGTAPGNGSMRVMDRVQSIPTLPPETPQNASLDAVTDARHWTYKVPGAIAVAVLTWLFVAIAAFPQALQVMVQVLAGYLTLRFLIIVVFYPIGLLRIRHTERRAASLAGLPRPEIPEIGAPVHHIVILPNYREPMDVLARTLDRLAEQERARDCLTVVLAMEESEPDSERKGRELARRYADRFARVFVTVHPRGLPDEEVGKGSNESWAARQAKAKLVDQLGLPIGAFTVSSCDADSLFHPSYFAELGRQFAGDADRYHRFWQAPFRYANNVWHVPAPVRMLGLLNNMVQVSELANPLAVNMPLSTYSLSLQLAHEVGYWDEAVIAEDWHMFLRSIFGSAGRTRLRPLFLPTTADAVGGPTFMQGLQNSYRQRVRHGWGSSDMGYILQQWTRQAGVPLHRKLLFLVKMIHDHTFFTLAGLVLGIGSLAVFAQRGIAAIAQPGLGVYDVLFQVGNVVTAVGTAAIWFYEHQWARQQGPGWQPRHLVEDIVTWPLLAVSTMLLIIAPTLEAQWRQMLGGRLTYAVTSKTLPTARKS